MDQNLNLTIKDIIDFCWCPRYYDLKKNDPNHNNLKELYDNVLHKCFYEYLLGLQNNSSINDKVIAEIEYLDSTIIEMMNKLNNIQLGFNINIERKEEKIEEGSKDEDSASENSDSKNSSKKSDGSNSEDSAESGSSDSGGSKGKENSNGNSKNNTSDTEYEKQMKAYYLNR